MRLGGVFDRMRVIVHDALRVLRCDRNSTGDSRDKAWNHLDVVSIGSQAEPASRNEDAHCQSCFAQEITRSATYLVRFLLLRFL